MRSEELKKEFEKCEDEIKKATNFIKAKNEEALVIKGRYHEALENEKVPEPTKVEEVKKDKK